MHNFFFCRRRPASDFDEFDDERMMDLHEATTTPPRSPVKQPSVAEEDRVGSSDRVAGARGTSPTLEAVEEVAGTLPDDRAEAVTPLTLKDVGLESFPAVGREDAPGHLPAADGARTIGGVSSSGVAAQSLEVSLGQTGTDPVLGLFF